MMEISQALVFAICYAVIAVAVRLAFPVLFWFCVAEIPYSFVASGHSRGADLLMLLWGYAACIEALWHALKSEYRPARAWAVVSAGALAALAVIPSALQMPSGYLTFRHLSLAGLAVCFIVITLLDLAVRPLACDRLARINLRLLCVWLTARAASSLAFPFYSNSPDAWRIWRIAGWAFLAVLAGIAACYGSLMVGRDLRRLLVGWRKIVCVIREHLGNAAKHLRRHFVFDFLQFFLNQLANIFHAKTSLSKVK